MPLILFSNSTTIIFFTDMLSYDLSSLKNYEEDIQLKDKLTNTYFSVCKPTVLSGCPYGSAICSMIHDSNGKIVELRGYGNAVQSPKIEQELQVVSIHIVAFLLCKTITRT